MEHYMQRSAGLLLVLAVLSQLGCENPQRAAPEPLMFTRSPQPVAPAPPMAVAPTPAPLPKPQPAPPKPVASDLDTTGLIPRGGINRGQWSVIVVHHSES